jgi:hypothetical protein
MLPVKGGAMWLLTPLENSSETEHVQVDNEGVSR